jgi:hypothetical protein
MKKLAYTIVLAAAVSVGAYHYAHVGHMKPLAEPPQLLKGDTMAVINKPTVMAEVDSLMNAQNYAAASKISQSIVESIKKDSAKFDGTANALIPLFAPPHLDVKGNVQNHSSKAALDVLKAFPEKSIEFALANSDKYLLDGPDSHYTAMGNITSAIVGGVPSVKKFAENRFKEVLSSEGDWGAKIIVGICAVKNRMVDLSTELADAALRSTSLQNIAQPKQYRRILITLSEELNSQFREEFLKKYPHKVKE